MCGIVGIVSSRVDLSPERLIAMRDSLAHRGPDDAGVWAATDGSASLAHRRLSIIDLSRNACQPMVDRLSGVAIVYNGEIYNYRELRRELISKGHVFRTDSDTEVLLAAYHEWGRECLTRLNGMFAFAIYDEAHRTLFAARDRAGKKPFFYTDSGGDFRFASELKALMADPDFPRVMSMEALNFYLTYGYVTGDRSILQGVKKLLPGHALWLDGAGRIRVWRYWDLPPAPTREEPTPALLDELEAILTDAVRLRLVADVSVGILLSGGLDSSLVTALAARATDAPVRTFTITFPDHPDYDEARFARIVARQFGTEHHELVAEPTSFDLLPRLAWQFDEPLASSSTIPTYLVSRLVREHATVALGGDGGDELFGGYSHYSRLQHLSRLQRWVPAAARRGISDLAVRHVPPDTRAWYYMAGFRDPGWMLAHVNILFDSVSRARLLRAEAAEAMHDLLAPERYKAELFDRRRGSVLQKATAADFRSYLPDDILMKVDRASMLASLEVRAPLLDPRVVEFAFGRTPDQLRAATDERKILPRFLGVRVLPPELDLKRKQGFSIPLSRWVSGSWNGYLREVLSEVDPALFDRGAIQRMLDRPGRESSRRLFGLTMFELWRREHDVKIDGRS